MEKIYYTGPLTGTLFEAAQYGNIQEELTPLQDVWKIDPEQIKNDPKK